MKDVCQWREGAQKQIISRMHALQVRPRTPCLWLIRRLARRKCTEGNITSRAGDTDELEKPACSHCEKIGVKCEVVLTALAG